MKLNPKSSLATLLLCLVASGCGAASKLKERFNPDPIFEPDRIGPNFWTNHENIQEKAALLSPKSCEEAKEQLKDIF